MIVGNIVREVVEEFIKKDIINEYLDKDYGTPLYKFAKKNFDDVGVVKKQWLVHCAWDDESAESIMKNGFTNGVSKDNISWDSLTDASTAERSDRGYAWAYKADDIINPKDYDTFEYNKYVGMDTSLLFQASGVEYYNEFDDEMQVIFDNKSPQNMILIYKWDGLGNQKNKYASHEFIRNNVEDNEELFGVGNVNGKPLYVNTFGNVVKWCIDNFGQYRKYLLSNKTVLHSSYYTDDFQKEYEEYLDKNGFGELPSNAINLHSKWYSVEDSEEDYNYREKLEKEEYEKFLAQHKEEAAKAQKEYEMYLREKHYDEMDELPPWVTNHKEYIFRKYGLDRSSFINNFRKTHVYYGRKRPDGEYWKY